MTKYYYDGDSTRLLYETDGSGALQVRYIYGDDYKPEAMVRGGNTYYFHYNGHGDVVALTNATGAVVAEYDYDAYGLPVTTGLEGSVVNPIRYAGYYYDAETGMYYLNARYYRADLGRFITRDTFHGFEDNPMSLNQYAYAHGNPVMFVDPDGHIAVWVQQLLLRAWQIGLRVWNFVVRMANNMANKLYGSARPILSGTYNPVYRQKLIDVYARFHKQGYILSEHAMNKLMGHVANGRISSIDNAMKALKYGKTYVEPNGNLVRFGYGVSAHINAKGIVESIVPRAKAIADWRLIQ